MIALVSDTSPMRARQGDPDPVYDAEGFAFNRDFYSPLPFENIDVISGNVVFSFTDAVLPGNAGFDLAFVRTYNSHFRKWRFGVAGVPMSVSQPAPVAKPNPLPEDLIPYLMPVFRTVDGAEHKAVWMEATNTGSDLLTKTFWRYTYAQRRLHLPNGWVATYDRDVGSTALLTKVEDGFGNFAVVNYRDNNSLSEVIQNLGSGQERTVTFFYGSGSSSLPERMETPQGTWEYSFTGDPEVSPKYTSARPPAGGHWTYSYLGGSALQAGLMESITTPNGGSVSYDWEQHGFTSGAVNDRTGQPLTKFSFVIAHRTTNDLRNTGGSWDFTYDNVGVTIVGPQSKVKYSATWNSGSQTPNRREIFEPQGSSPTETTTLTYDHDGVRLADRPGADFVVPVITNRVIARDGRTYTTTYTYRSTDYGDLAHPHTITEQGDLSRTTTLTYDHDFGSYIRARLTEMKVNASGQFFPLRRSYGDDGFLESESRFDVTTTFGRLDNGQGDWRGNTGSATNANQATTSFTYSWGSVKDIRTPEYLIERAINADDGTIATERRDHRTRFYEYDEISRVTRRAMDVNLQTPTIASYAVNGSSIMVSQGANGRVTQLDGFGRPVKTTDNAGVFIAFAYDAEGRKTYESYPSGAGTPEHGDHFSYDALGRLTRRSSPEGGDVEYVRRNGGDGLDLEIKEALDTAPGGRRTTTQKWQAFGDPDDARLRALTDAHGKPWFYDYNGPGKLTAIDEPIGEPGSKERRWSYDPQTFFLTAEVHPESGDVTYTHDDVGNVKSKADARGVIVWFGYDGNNRLRTIDAPGEDDDFAIDYDHSDNRTALNGKIARSTFLFDGVNRLRERIDTIAAQGFTTAYGYNDSDHLISIDYPRTGRFVSYSRGAEGRVTQVRSNAEGGGGTFRVLADGFSHHASGAVAAYDAGNGATTSMTFDDRHRPRRVVSGPLDVTYGYDNVGNVTTADDVRGTGFGSDYAYDLLDRLIGVDRFGATTITYDDLGNRTSMGGNGYTYHPSQNRRLIHVAGPQGGAIDYTEIGSVKQDNQGTYDYNNLNNLRRATVGGNVTDYSYDGDNIRKHKADAAGEHFYIHGPGSQLLAEFLKPAGGGIVMVREYAYVGTRLLSSFGASGPPPPTLTIAISSPQANTTIATGSVVTLTATVPTRGSHTVARVEFWQGGTFIGSDSTEHDGFSAVWRHLPPLAGGQFALFARVVTTTGESELSTPVFVTVNAFNETSVEQGGGR